MPGEFKVEGQCPLLAECVAADNGQMSKLPPLQVEIPRDGKSHELFRVERGVFKFPVPEAEQLFFQRAKKYYLDRAAGSAGLLQDTPFQIYTEGPAGAISNLVNHVVYIAHDFKHGIRFRYAALKDAGLGENIIHFARHYPGHAEQELAHFQLGYESPQRGVRVDWHEMTVASRVLLYTDRMLIPPAEVSAICKAEGLNVELIIESELMKSAFISYGGPDGMIVGKINDYLISRGVTTWFFPRDAVPGQKLHRMMFDGVNSHDRLLLLCSKNSLSRPGVLHEIEQALVREAKEGGSDVLIPIALDDYVFADWAPQRPDLAHQVRSRVIAKVDVKAVLKLRPGMENEDLDRVVAALTGLA